MQMGEVIRNHRKQLGLTQEEMASRLGVTAPAVNKWENGNSLPDITLLAPIARLLHVTLEELLSFRENLTEEEVIDYVREFAERAKEEPFEAVYDWAASLMREHPNCDLLTLRMAQQMQALRVLGYVEDPERYDGGILQCFERVLNSSDANLKKAAAGCLISYSMQKEQYDKAEEYLAYYDEQDPYRQSQQALICIRTGRTEEGCRLWEQLMFSCTQLIGMALGSLIGAAMDGGEMDRAHYLADKHEQLNRVMDMGPYQEALAPWQVAMKEKDADGAIAGLQALLKHVDSLSETYSHSPLYAHLKWKSPSEEFGAEFRSCLLKGLQDDESLDFLRDDPRFRAMLE